MKAKTANTPAQNAVAAAMILGMLACLGLVVYAGQKINEDIGPNALAAGPDGKLYVASHGKVHVFASESRREAAYDLAAMGASRIPADLAVHSDGRLFVADPKLARLLACDMAKARCGSHDMGLIGWTPAHLVPGNTFKFALDVSRGRIYVSDNGGHRLLITDATGKILASTSANAEVVFPNQVQSYAPGELTVADTNHSRIVTFDIAGDRIGKVVREFPIRTSGVGRPGRVWPFGMARLPDGRFWVMAARDGMKDADVVLFDASGRALRRIDLGPDSDPFAIALWNGTMVVGDARNYRLQAFDADGSRLRDIRDPGFEAELRQVHVAAEAWRGHRFHATIAMVVFPIVGVIVLWRMGVPITAPSRQPIARPTGITAGPASELRWLQVDAEFAKLRARNLVAMAFVVVVVVAALFFLLYFAAKGKPLGPAHLARLSLMAIVSIGVVGALSWIAISQRKHAGLSQVGVSARGLHLRTRPWHGLGDPVAGVPVPWRDVYFDGRRLFADGFSAVLVKPPMGPEMFTREVLEREVLARIPAANFISSSKLGWKIVAGAPPMAKILYIVMIIVFVASFLR